MAQTIQHGFAVPELNKQVLLSLDLVRENNALDFHTAFKRITGDSLVAELEASGRILKTGTEDFDMLIDHNKNRNLFRVTADVVVVDEDTPITVTVENYTDAGETLSAPAVGLHFLENSTNIEFEVTAVNKGTAGAHTATIKPVRSTVEPVTIDAADAEFISLGRPNVQESSFQQDGEYEGWSRMKNWTRIIRTNKQYSDLASMIQLVERNGMTYYDLDATSITRQHVDVKEMALIDGDIVDSSTATGNQNTQARGLVPLVKEYGTSLDGGGGGVILNDDFFRDLSRAIKGNGTSNDYQGLIGSEAYYAIRDFLQSSANVQVFQNANEGDIKVIFDYDPDFKIYGVNYSFKDYAYWNSARLAGADVTKSPKAYQMLLIPTGGFVGGNGWQDYLRLRYLDNSIATDEGQLNKLDYDGALFNRNTTRNGQISVTSYMGIEANDLDSFVFAQLPVA